MHRSSTSRDERPGGWSSSLTVTPRSLRSTAPVLIALPDRRRRLSEGIVVEASVLGRVLGLQLLKLDATVVVVPARVAAPYALDDHPEPPPARALGSPAERSRPIGGRLAEAARTIDEGAELLARATRGHRAG